MSGGRGRSRAVIASVVLAFGAVIVGAPAASVGAPVAQSSVYVSPDDGATTLPTGHTLVATRSWNLVRLDSANGRFELMLYNNAQLQIENHLRIPHGGGAGSITWLQQRRGKSPHRAELRMQRDGNLVMLGFGHVLWSSHTAGTGAHNYAKMLDGGSLVVRTSSGRTVWSSRTTATEMTAGDRLLSGRTLVNRLGRGAPTRLTMRPGGDLVLQRGHHTVWHSGTHVRGSSMLVTAAGRAAVVTPSGRTVWRSTSVGDRPLLNVAEHGRLLLSNIVNVHRCWHRPLHSGNCNAG